MVNPVQAEQDASQFADAFWHAFVGDNMDEDEGSGAEGNKDQEEDKDDEMDVDDPVGVARMSAKAWVSNSHPYIWQQLLLTHANVG